MSKIRSQQIRVRGTPKKFYAGEKEIKIEPMPDGMFFDESRGLFIKVVDYDNHVIGLNPNYIRKKKNAWFALCSCGAPAIVVGYNAYAKGASPVTGGRELAQGELIVCSSHINTGKHADGST